jgi:beta-lactamase regulating signal transducer with metallopeptidase domain/Tol biopolymer transport system component
MNAILEAINSMGKVFVGFAWPMLVQSSLLIAVLLGLDVILRKRARAVLRYWIWMIVLVKLMLPTTLASPTSPAYWLSDGLRSLVTGKYFRAETSATKSVVTGIPLAPSVRSRSNAVASSGGNTDPQPAFVPSVGADRVIPPAMSTSLMTWQGYVLVAWLASVVVMMALLIQRTLFVRSLVAQSEMASDAMAGILQLARQQMHVTTRVGLRLSHAIASPSVCGLVRPTVLIPQNLSGKVSEQRCQAILLHELAHIKRGDLWVSCIQTIVQIVYVYHPLLWVANASIRKVREQAADEMVLVALGEEADDYPKTLLDVSRLAFGSPALSLHFLGVAESKKALHRRIKHMLTRPVPKSARIGALGTIAILVVAAVLLPMARAERSNKDASVTPSATATETAPKASVAGQSDTIIDPNSGLKFVATKTISGANDVIDDENWVTLSLNGKFLLYLWKGRIVPLDGSPAFALKELQGRDVDMWSAAWSPDGQKIAFHAGGIEVLPVSPDTGRPTGPARKLLEDKERWFRGRIYWSADSERILFVKKKNDVEWEAGSSITLRDGRVNRQPDYADFGLVSPDGNTIAYSIPTDGIWTRPVNGGAPRIARARSRGWIEDAQLWTADSRWVVSVVDGWGWKNVHFTRLSDGRNFDLFSPEAVGAFLGKSPDGQKLYFYRSSFDPSPDTFKVVPISGGPVSSLGAPGRWEERWDYSWTSDSASLTTLDWGFFGEQQLWLIPLKGGDRVRFNLESLGKENPWLWGLSPDGRKLLYAVRRGKDRGIQSVDLYIVPISLKEGRAMGPATLVFEGLQSRHPEIPKQELAWSPDGTRIAMPLWTGSKRDLWILSADGGKPVQIGEDTGPPLMWSPDGKMIAFRLVAADRQMLQVIPAEGGTARTVLTTPKEQSVPFGWSPDSKELVVACDGTITSIPIAGGTGRVIARWQDAGYESVSWFGWSPDGQHLAFEAGKGGEASRLCLFSPDTGGIATLNNSPEDASHFTWSPDGKMICCTVEEPVKTRPAGVIRELDVAEALQKAPPVAEKKPAEIKPAPQAEPITGPVFSDNFDNGLSKHWRFQDMPDAGLGPGRHAVENGELMLADARAILDVPDWTDYIVTVRVCMKEVVASGDGGFGISARAVPSQFGSSRMDRYGLGIFWNNAAPYLCLGLYYADASNTLRRGMLRQSSYSAVIDKWYTLEFEVRGQQLRGYLDGKLMVEATDTRLSKGKLWIEANKSRALFDDFSVRQLP